MNLVKRYFGINVTIAMIDDTTYIVIVSGARDINFDLNSSDSTVVLRQLISTDGRQNDYCIFEMLTKRKLTQEERDSTQNQLESQLASIKRGKSRGSVK